MKTLLRMPLPFLLVAAALFAAGSARAADDTCRFYGFAPHTRDYAICRANVRHYWTTGPCADAQFAGVHPRFCHVYPWLDF
jgi:hypothetical protein